MKALLFIFSLTIIGGRSIHWKKIDDLKESFVGYNESAEKLFEMILHKMNISNLRAAQFIEDLTDSYLLITPQLNETDCYRFRFQPERIQDSFKSIILRYHVPLQNLLAELRGKLDGIKGTIIMYQDLADSKYSICKVYNMNASCEDETNEWLEGIVSTVECQITPTCHRHVISKRSATNYCETNQYLCKSGECIPNTYVCDGSNDCSDGSDENDCCFPNSVYCRDRNQCIQNSRICDGHEDCGDGSDERECGGQMNNCTIQNGLYKCESEKCIGLDQVCDGNRDCKDGSDEGYHCGMGVCPEECTKKGGVCFHGPRGPLCFSQCPLGTFESPEGCTARPQPTNRTVIELLEEIPKLAYRQNTMFTYLKMKAIATVTRIMSDVFKCLDPNYPALQQVLSLPIYNETDDESHVTKSYLTDLQVTTESDP